MSTGWNHFNLSCGNRISVNIGRKRGEVVIGMRESEKRKKTRNDMKKMGMKTARGTQKRAWKSSCKRANISCRATWVWKTKCFRKQSEESQQQRERGRKWSQESRGDKLGLIWGPRKGRKLLNQSPFDTGSTLSYLFLLDKGKIIHFPLCKIIWHSWFKNLRACSLPKQHFRKF